MNTIATIARSTVPVRLHAVLLALVLLVAGLVGAATVAPVAAQAAAPSPYHPYSDPTWYPVHASSRIDCVKNNPGCTKPRSFWAISIVPDGQYGANARKSVAGVFAMGAGIVHYGVAHGTACGGASSFGTWIYIDHGAGTFSRYGHLSSISVVNGARVAAGQQIGVVGTTGKNSNCALAYTTVEVLHHGLADPKAVQISSLRACVGTARTSTLWPSGFDSRYQTWNQVPQNMGNYPHPSLPANTSACIPNAAALTATQPAPTGVVRSGSGRVTARWPRPAAAFHVNVVTVELSRFRSGSTWDTADQETYYSVAPTTTSHEFSKLLRHHPYRVRISFHNAAGWSLDGGWRTVTTS